MTDQMLIDQAKEALEFLVRDEKINLHGLNCCHLRDPRTLDRMQSKIEAVFDRLKEANWELVSTKKDLEHLRESR